MPSGQYENDTKFTPETAFEMSLEWIKGERDYTLKKFGIEADLNHVEDFYLHMPDRETWWNDQLNSYLYRAGLLGLDTPNGRQALAKFAATAVNMLSATIQVYGHLPEPGVSSGEIRGL